MNSNKKGKIGIVVFVLLFFLVAMSLTVLVGAAEQNITTCMTLDTPDTTYYLQNDVKSDSTCFNITYPNGLVGNITLDCQGNDVSYAEMYSGSGFRSIVWVPRHDIGIKNCHFFQKNSSVNDSYGVELAAVNGVVMSDNTFDFKGPNNYGIYLYDTDPRYPAAAYNFNITNTAITSSSNGGTGINIAETFAPGIINHLTINMAGNGVAGIRFGGTWTNVTDFNMTGVGPMYGLYFRGDNYGNNRVDGCDIILTSSGGASGVLFYVSAVGNTIDNCSISVQNTSDNAAVKYWGGAGNITNNKFRNTYLSNTNAVNDTWISVLGGGVNNYTNVSWLINKRYWFYSSGQLENFYYKNWVSVYVNDTDGNPVEGANVTIKDSYGSYHYIGTTGIDGYITNQEITYQKVNHTESPWRENLYNYSNYNMSGTKGSQGLDYKIRNVTTNLVGADKVFLTLTAAGPSLIQLIAPTNSSYRNNDSGFSFLCNVSGSGLINATLHSNFSGSWAPNKTTTLSGDIDIAQFIFQHDEIPEGAWSWSCSAFDSTGGKSASVNWTLNNDYTAPTIYMWRPDMGSVHPAGNITFQLKCYDQYSGQDELSLYGNWSGDPGDPQATNSSPLYNAWWDVNESITNNGYYSWYGVCYDTAGNYRIGASKYFWVDNTTIPVTGCMNITGPGTYVLQHDIIDSTEPYACIVINSSNVTFNGNEYIISGVADHGSIVSIRIIGDYINNNILIENLYLKRWPFGINSRNNKNITIKNIHFERMYIGITFYSNNDTVISDSTFYNLSYIGLFFGQYLDQNKNVSIKNNSFLDILEKAISNNYLINSFISNNTITNATTGIYLDSANNVTIEWTNISQSSDIGISSSSDGNVTIQNNKLEKNKNGMILFGSNYLIKNNLINSSENTGLSSGFLTASNISIINNRFLNNSYNRTLSGGDLRLSTFSNLRKDYMINNTFGINYPTTISAIPFIDDLIHFFGVELNQTNPPTYKNIGKFINLSEDSAGESMNVTFFYSDSDYINAGVDEPTLTLMRYNGTNWGSVAGQTLNQGGNFIFSNLTEFGVFGLFGQNFYNQTDCGNLTSPDGYYSLTGNVASTGTCFTISANNITINCNGRKVSYANSGTGYGVFEDTHHSNLTILNCLFDSGNAYAGSHGIYLIGTNIGRFDTNSFSIDGDDSFGIYLDGSGWGGSEFEIKNNNFTLIGKRSIGVYSLSGMNNYIHHNIINLTNSDSYGITFLNGMYNNFTSNNYYIRGVSSYDFISGLASSGVLKNETFRNSDDITDSRRINATFSTQSPNSLAIDWRDEPGNDPANYTNVSQYLYITGYKNLDFFWFYNITISACGPPSFTPNCASATNNKPLCNGCDACLFAFASCGGGTPMCPIWNGNKSGCDLATPSCVWNPGSGFCDVAGPCNLFNEPTCEYVVGSGAGCSVDGPCTNIPMLCRDVADENSCSMGCGGAFGCGWVNGSVGNESNLKLLRYTGSAWTLVSSTVDPTNNFIHSNMQNLIQGYGTFAIMEQDNESNGDVNAPTDLYIQMNIDNVTTTVNWSEVGGAEGYFIYTSDNLTELINLVPGQEFYEQATLLGQGNTTYNDTTANESIRRFYRVAAFVDGGLTTNISEVAETVGKYTITITPGEKLISLPLNESRSLEYFLPISDEFSFVYYQNGTDWLYDYFFGGSWIKTAGFDNLEFTKGYLTRDFISSINITNTKKIPFGEVNTTILPNIESTLAWESITTGEKIDDVIPMANEFAFIYSNNGSGWTYDYYFGGWIKTAGFDTFEPTNGYLTRDFSTTNYLNYTRNPYLLLPF